MALQDDILLYGNRAQTRIAELGAEVEEQMRQGIDYTSAVEEASLLMIFQRSLFSPYCPWTDAEKAEWIAWMTDEFELTDIPYVDYDMYIAPVVVPSDTSGGVYVTHGELNDAVTALENADSALDTRVTALENFDYSTIIPTELLDQVAQNTADIAELNSDFDELLDAVVDNEATMNAHIGDSSIHVTPTDKSNWNAKPTQAELTTALSGKSDVGHTHTISQVTGLNSALNSLQEQINDLPEPEDGEDGVTPNISIGTVETGEVPSVEIDPESTPEAPVLNFVIPKGEKGDAFEFDAVDLFENRSDYDGEDPGFTFLAYDTGDYYIMTESSWGPAIKFAGDDGWSPKLAIYTVSPSKEVFEIVGWIGGTGTPPQYDIPEGADPETVRFFIADTGVTTFPEMAKNIKGNQGPDGPVTPFIINASGTDRSIYDGQAKGFTFLNTTTGKVSFKLTDTSADWSAEYQWQGAGGAGLTWKGPWATATIYAENDLVYHVADGKGSSWICILGHTSDGTTEPGIGGSWATNWALFAEGGEQGEDGEPGADGATGGQVAVNQVGHGYTELNILGISESGTLELYDGTNEYAGIVLEVVDVDNFILQNGGYINDPGIDEGEFWYGQDDGTIDPLTPTDLVIIIGIKAGTGWVKPALGGAGAGASGLSSVLAVSDSAGGQQIKDLASGSDPNDAVTLSQMESSIESESALLIQSLGSTAHGFSVGDCLTLVGTDYEVISDPTTQPLVGIVIEVADANNFKLQMGGWSAHLNLAAGHYYVQTDGTLDTVVTPLFGYISMGPFWGYIPARVPMSSSGGAGAPAREVYAFNGTMFTEDSKMFRGVLTALSGYTSAALSGVTFEVRLDSSSSWTAQANIAAVESWIGSNISGNSSTGTKFWIKVLATYSGSGLAQYVMTYTPTV